MIAFVAPFPSPGEVCEGWLSRIAAVDRIFAREPRVYIHIIDPDGAADAEAGLPAPLRMSELVEVYRLDLSYMAHQQKLRELILQAQLVYVHTLHWARYVIPFYKTGKVVTDIHGVTPEEELLYGRPEVARFYQEIERQVFAEAQHAVVVTQAMADHYRKKYPESRIELTVLPVFETIFARADARLSEEAPAARPRVLYSGGAQRWQKLDAMMELAQAQAARCDFTFLSGDPQPFREAARRRGIEERVAIRSAKKDELAPLYLQADYGLVLRDDIAVNRVACPTKLSEYLWFGIIPVVCSPSLGDFPALGYRYVTFEQMLAGELPPAAERREMMAKNLRAIARLQDGFAAAAQEVLALKDRVPSSALEPLHYLSDYERNVVYPAQSELHLIAADAQAPQQILYAHYASPTGTLAFALDGARALAQLRFMPINRQCQLRLGALRLSDGEGRPIPFFLSGNYAEKSGDIYTFRVRSPLFVLQISPAARPAHLVAKLELLRVGHELPPPVSALRARLRKMPRVVKTYQTAQALLRRFAPRPLKG